MYSLPLYSPINSLESEIRLLTIEPARTHEAPITCHLSVARLSSNPIYDALSYTWGAPGEGDDMSIIVSWQLPPPEPFPMPSADPTWNQQQQYHQPPHQPPVPPQLPTTWQQTHAFRLQDNASAAIRRLRHPTKPRTIWIDAVCINQDDKAGEKEGQLPLMRRIYEQAEQVCIWLGEMTELSPLGVDDMQSRVGREYKFWNPTSAVFNRAATNLLAPSGILKNGVNSVATMHSAMLTNELVLGEVRELLARPWWTRVWIMQEAIVARRLRLMCGEQTFEWEGVGRAVDRMKGLGGARGAIEVFGTVMNPEMLVEDQTYRLISRFREMWAKKRWNVSIFELMYEFRRLDCTDPRDRVFGFLGLAEAVVDFGIKPDGKASTADVFIRSARAIIEKSGCLDLLNCKTEWKGVERATRVADSLAYSLQDQARYHDVQATVSDGPNALLRKGWARLPPGWERVQRENPKFWSRFKDGMAGKGCYYWDHNTENAYEQSPLAQLPPPKAHHPVKQRVLPPGWIKTWDSVGRVQVRYNLTPDGQQQQQPKPATTTQQKKKSTKLNSLPSWVPNWSAMTALDPEPLLDWSVENPRYWACGKYTTPVLDTSQASSRTIGVEGILFDEIDQIAPPWHPVSPIPPITRFGIPELQAWVDLALSSPTLPIDDGPYTSPSSPISYQIPPDGTNDPRKAALWRTLMADYAGHLAAPPSDWSMVELWHDTRHQSNDRPHKSWAKQLPDLDTIASLGIGGHSKMSANISHLDSDMFSELLEIDYKSAKVLSSEKKYGEMMRRIFRVCKHRAMFVTRGGYIGLAPWNAVKGDRVVVLKGGRTPYLVRLEPVVGRCTLVGEAYVYGVMAGEGVNGVRGFDGSGGGGGGDEKGLAWEMFYLV